MRCDAGVVRRSISIGGIDRLALCALVLCAGAQLAMADVPVSPDRTPERPGPRALLSRLDDSSWSNREEATRGLIDFGTSIYGELSAAYRQSTSAEVRRRIRYIVREIHYSAAAGPILAFLGVEPQHVNGESHPPRVFPGATGVNLRNVIAGSAAFRAGLMSNDLIVSVNGSAADGHDTALAFTEWIGSQRPGSQCRLTVVRGCEGFLYSAQTMSGFDPRGFAKLATRAVTRADNPMIPENAVALEITDVGRADTRLGLKQGDLIISIDGAPVPPEGAVEALKQWANTAQVPILDPRERRLQVIPGLRQNANAFRNDQPSVRVLRGGKVLEIDVVLGERPPYLQDGRMTGGRAGQRGVSAQKIAEADAAFEVLWATRFADSDPNADDATTLEIP